MKGSVDTGSEASFISRRMVERAGLPMEPLGENLFRARGIDGKGTACEYWVTRVPIYLAP